jgi:hypothetical protein
MLYLVAYKNDKGKYLIKIGLDDGKEKWASTSEAVYNFAKANFAQKEEVEYDMTEKNGQYHVSKIMKKGQKSSAPAPVATAKTAPVSETSKTTEYKCTDCGATLKDGKYTKCYPCNKKNPAPAKTTSGGGQRDAVGQSIEKQAMMKASAMAVGNAFVGQIADVDTLADMIIKVYEKLLKKLTE